MEHQFEKNFFSSKFLDIPLDHIYIYIFETIEVNFFRNRGTKVIWIKKICTLTYSIPPNCARNRSPRTYFVSVSPFRPETIRFPASNPDRFAAAWADLETRDEIYSERVEARKFSMAVRAVRRSSLRIILFAFSENYARTIAHHIGRYSLADVPFGLRFTPQMFRGDFSGTVSNLVIRWSRVRQKKKKEGILSLLLIHEGINFLWLYLRSLGGWRTSIEWMKLWYSM